MDETASDILSKMLFLGWTLAILISFADASETCTNPPAACPPSNGCIFGHLGVDVGARCKMDSIESMYRVSIEETTAVVFGSATIRAGTVFTNWNTYELCGMFVPPPVPANAHWRGTLRNFFDPIECERDPSPAPPPAGPRTHCPTELGPVGGANNSTFNITVDHEMDKEVVLLPGSYNHLEVFEKLRLVLMGPGRYHFRSIHLHDNSVVVYDNTTVDGNVQLTADEDIIIEHNVVWENFGPRGGDGGHIDLLFAKNEDNLLGEPSRGLQIWNAPMKDPPILYVSWIMSNGNIWIGHRQEIMGCISSARYVQIASSVSIHNDGEARTGTNFDFLDGCPAFPNA